MKSFAIFNYSGKASGKGGPIGYLSHLYSGFVKDVPELLSITQSGTKMRSNVTSSRSITSNIAFLFEIKSIFSYIKKGLLVRKKYASTINSYELLHLHESESVFYLRFFAKYKGKIILTSHRPEPLADEVINSMRAKLKGRYRLLYLFLEWIEKYSYNKADAFIFPSVHAARIYEKFPGFVEHTRGKSIEYVVTGLNFKSPTASKEEYFKQHNIKLGLDKKVVSYIGRHNCIKGYDRVVSSFDIIRKNDACVIVAGAPGTIEYPKDDNWVELGYISDAMNLMNLSDIVFIPNRNTYFDLVIIEALSLGKIVITSNTGGNLDIAEDCKGLLLFDNEQANSFIDVIDRVLNMNEEERKLLENSSRNYYENYCTPSIFAKNYFKTISKLSKVL